MAQRAIFCGMGIVALVLLAGMSASSAADCGDCADWRCGWLGCGCVPRLIDICRVRGFDPRKGVHSVLRVVDALASGNSKEISTSIGAVILSAPNCVGCEEIAHTVLPHLSTPQLQQIVGEGFLVYTTTGSPVLLVVDVGLNLVHPEGLGGKESRRVALCPGCSRAWYAEAESV